MAASSIPTNLNSNSIALMSSSIPLVRCLTLPSSAKKNQEDLDHIKLWTEKRFKACLTLLNKKNKCSTFQLWAIHLLSIDTHKPSNKHKKFCWVQIMMVMFLSPVSYTTGSIGNGAFHWNTAFRPGIRFTHFCTGW